MVGPHRKVILGWDYLSVKVYGRQHQMGILVVVVLIHMLNQRHPCHLLKQQVLICLLEVLNALIAPKTGGVVTLVGLVLKLVPASTLP